MPEGESEDFDDIPDKEPVGAAPEPVISRSMEFESEPAPSVTESNNPYAAFHRPLRSQSFEKKWLEKNWDDNKPSFDFTK